MLKNIQTEISYRINDLYQTENKAFSVHAFTLMDQSGVFTCYKNFLIRIQFLQFSSQTFFKSNQKLSINSIQCAELPQKYPYHN